MKITYFILAIFSVFSLLGCHAQTENIKQTAFQQKSLIKKETTVQVVSDKSEVGLASYYGDSLNGHKTANGEIFNNKKLTAAHKKLPFGTYVKVTALWNNKSVVVRINDRGPYPKGRIIDLSKAAAKEINLVGKGIGKVKVEIIDPKNSASELK